jgi:hypothetical protein
VGNLDLGDDPVDDPDVQATTHDLDLRQLGHVRP